MNPPQLRRPAWADCSLVTRGGGCERAGTESATHDDHVHHSALDPGTRRSSFLEPPVVEVARGDGRPIHPATPRGPLTASGSSKRH